MIVNKNRPTNLTAKDLRAIKMPVTAISSLLHRITGIVLFISIPFILWGLSNTLSTEANYNNLLVQIHSSTGLFIVWVILSSLSYHILAGFRHLLMDMGFGETMETAKISSWSVILLAVVAAILWGVWLW